jgi:hypothetical protein
LKRHPDRRAHLLVVAVSATPVLPRALNRFGAISLDDPIGSMATGQVHPITMAGTLFGSRLSASRRHNVVIGSIHDTFLEKGQ